MYPTKRSTTSSGSRTRAAPRPRSRPTGSDAYAGGIGWCAFDYNTHEYFGSGDRICYHGVSDIFRIPKPAAGFYKSQCDPTEEIVLEPAFPLGARRRVGGGSRECGVCSNCEHLKFYVADKLVAEADPNKQEFAHLRYAPFVAELGKAVNRWGDLRIDGYIGGKVVISKTMSGKGVDQKFTLLPDDTKLIADGADTTRVVLRVTDEFGAIRPFANDAIRFELDGPAEIIGDNPIRPDRWHGRHLDSREGAAGQGYAYGHTRGFGQAAGYRLNLLPFPPNWPDDR